MALRRCWRSSREFILEDKAGTDSSRLSPLRYLLVITERDNLRIVKYSLKEPLYYTKGNGLLMAAVFLAKLGHGGVVLGLRIGEVHFAVIAGHKVQIVRGGRVGHGLQSLLGNTTDWPRR